MSENHIVLNKSIPTDMIWKCLPDPSTIECPYGIARYWCNFSEINLLQKTLQIKEPILMATLFKLPPQSLGIIHVDKHFFYEQIYDNVAINLPLSPNNGTYMSWYRQNDPTKTYRDFGRAQKTVPKIEPDDCTKIESYEVKLPHVVKINDWHNIDNFSDTEFGYILSMRFDRELSFDDLIKLTEHWPNL